MGSLRSLLNNWQYATQDILRCNFMLFSMIWQHKIEDNCKGNPVFLACFKSWLQLWYMHISLTHGVLLTPWADIDLSFIVDFPLAMFWEFAIHLRAISQRMPKLLFPIMSLKIIHFKILSHIPGANGPDSKVHGANMGRTWALSAASGGSHVVTMNLVIRAVNHVYSFHTLMKNINTPTKKEGKRRLLINIINCGEYITKTPTPPLPHPPHPHNTPPLPPKKNKKNQLPPTPVGVDKKKTTFALSDWHDKIKSFSTDFVLTSFYNSVCNLVCIDIQYSHYKRDFISHFIMHTMDTDDVGRSRNQS